MTLSMTASEATFIYDLLGDLQSKTSPASPAHKIAANVRRKIVKAFKFR